MSLHTMQLSLLHLQLESRRRCSKTCRQGIRCGVARNNESYAPVSVRRDLRERFDALIQRKRLQRLHEEKEWERAIEQEEEHRQKNSTLKEKLLSRRYRPPTSIPPETRNDDETRSNAWKQDATLKDEFETRGSGRLANHQKRHRRMASAKLQRQPSDTANARGESFVEGILLNKIGSHSSGPFQSALASAFMRNQLQLKASRFRDLVEAVQKRHENEDPYRERRNIPSISEPEAGPSSIRWTSYDYNHRKDQFRLHSKKWRPRAPHKGTDDISGTPSVTRLQTETTSIRNRRKSVKDVPKGTEGEYIDW